jgi:ATP-binding cassette, subfamily F, member 3
MIYRQGLQAFIDRWRYNANRGTQANAISKEIVDLVVMLAPQAQARIKVLEKLPVLEPPEQDDTESFKSVSPLMLRSFPHREL